MNTEINVTLTLPLGVINMALAGLGELPAKQSLSSILAIQKQTQDFLNAQQAKTEELNPQLEVGAG
jgi:hypothetical protein